ncbi:MAG TPA: thiol reductant ABC exporter subunit CydC [Paenalcaligenes sp.]|nr:thiol reductant ABC exporter subunit CydC [Paenalcaligenes sp.]
MKLWWQLSGRWLRQHWFMSVGAIFLTGLTIFAGVGLLSVAGWFLTTAFLVTAMASFNYFIPSALVRGLSILRIVSRYLERVVGHQVTLNLQSEVRSRSFARIARLSPEQLARFRDGDLVARLVGDIDRLDTFFLLLVAPVIAGGIAGLFFSWVLGLFLPWVAWVVLLSTAVAIVGLPYWLARRSAADGQQVQEGFADLRAIAHDSFVAHSDLAVFNAENRVLGQFADTLERNALAADRLNAHSSLGTLIQQLLMGALVFLLLVIGGIAQTQAEMSAPMWVGLLFGLMGLFEVFSPVMRGASELGAVHAASARLHALQPTSSTTQKTTEGRVINALPTDAQNLEVTELSVKYGDASVLQRLSFSLPAGQRMVIQGLSGSGKTTLLQALMQIVPYGGKIYYGSTDLGQVQESVLYRHFAYLSQHSPVFLGTVRYNLLLGDPEASDDELWAALRAVQLEEHIRKIGGLDSWIGEGGNTLSAGQSRRLCLARIVLCPARLWLLDEPTAGLDEDTADALMRDLEGLSQGHSVIVVTHNVLPEAFARQTYRLVGGVLVRWLL